MTGNTTGEFWFNAHVVQADTIWGEIPYFKGELDSICYFRAITCFLDSKPTDIADRRALLAEYLKGQGYSAETINQFRSVLPADSQAGKLARNVCTLYGEEPQRVYSSDETVNTAMDDLYREGALDALFQDVHKYALFCNRVAVRPTFNKRGELRGQLIPPDMFRVVTDPDDPEEVLQMWIPYATEVDRKGNQQTVFRVWKDDVTYLANYKGEKIALTEEPNRYGRIPFVFLQMNESTDGDFYGGGLWEMTEIQIWANMQELNTTQSSIYNSFETWLGVNLDPDSKGLRISPGSLINVQQGGIGTDEAPADLRTVGATGQYPILSEFRRDRLREKLRDEGLPTHIVDDASAGGLTGIALTILERELTRIRSSHARKLMRFERQFAEMVALHAKKDQAMNLPDRFPEFGVKYAGQQVYLEPKDQLDLDLQKASEGLAYPSTIVGQYLGDTGGMSDEEAIATRDRLKGMWSGSTPNDGSEKASQTAEDAPIDPEGASIGEEDPTAAEEPTEVVE